MAKVLKNRAENDIKNKWNSMRRKLLRIPRKSRETTMKGETNSLQVDSANNNEVYCNGDFIPRDWSRAGTTQRGKHKANTASV